MFSLFSTGTRVVSPFSNKNAYVLFCIIDIMHKSLDVDILTPALDGTILPGLTRSSCLSLAAAHPSRTSLPNLSNSLRLHPHEIPITMADLVLWSSQGKLLEVFAVGTAVVVAPVG